jgi:hypothetical protein
MSTNSGSPQRKSSAIQSTPPAPSDKPDKGVQMVELGALSGSNAGRWLLAAGVGAVCLVIVAAAVAGGVLLSNALKTPEPPAAQVTPTTPEKKEPTPPSTSENKIETLAMPREIPWIEDLPLPREVAAVEPPPEPMKPDPKPEPEPAKGAKALSDEVKQGLEFLVKNQQKDTGAWGANAANWHPGGIMPKGGVQPANQPDQADLGPTCLATLALLRAGNTPKDGPYCKNMEKAVKFILWKIEKSDTRSIETSELKKTQLQYKIGPAVDTFLALLVLTELKGKMGDEKNEQRVTQAIQKLVGKVEANQKADGTFGGNEGWASVISHGLAVKALCRARDVGAKVSDATLDRCLKQAIAGLEPKAKNPKDPIKGKGGFEVGSIGSPGEGMPTDAGVSLYSTSANLAIVREILAANSEREKQARTVLADPNSRADLRTKAKDVVARIDEGRKVLDKSIGNVVPQLGDKSFVRGFGSNGGEEFISFMNLSESLVGKGGDEWDKWDKSVTDSLNKAQDRDGSWAGHHCITGKTACTSAALLTLMADRSPQPGSLKKEESK